MANMSSDPCFPEVMAPSPAAKVRVIHNPCRVQTIRKVKKLDLRFTNRLSGPAGRTRENRNPPSLIAQIETRMPISADLARIELAVTSALNTSIK